MHAVHAAAWLYLQAQGRRTAAVEQRTCLTVAAAVVTTLSEFLGSASSRKQIPSTAAIPVCSRPLPLSRYWLTAWLCV